MSELFSRHLSSEEMSVAIGALVTGVGIAVYQTHELFHISQGTNNVNRIHELQANISSLQKAEQVFATEHNPIRSQGEMVLNKAVNSNESKLKTMAEHRPIYAGGQEIESFTLGSSEILILAAAGVIGTRLVHRIKDGIKNRSTNTAF